MAPAESEAYVDAAAADLSLPLAAAHRPGVLHYVGFAAGMAELLAARPLSIDDEPAEAFVPIVPRP